jgi:hypothetical protein
MDKSLVARRAFSATNSRMLEAINAAAAAGNTRLLKDIQFVMTVNAYEELIDSGLYRSLKRKKTERRATDRRSGDRRSSGKR